MLHRGWLPLLFALALPAAAAADPDTGAFPLETRLQLLVQPRSILVIDERGGEREEALELGEQVRTHAVDGRVAFAVTDRRILAIAARAGSFQETRFGRGETLTAPVSIGDRVALFVTNQRVLGFDGGSGNLVESRLGPRERVERTAVADSVAVVTTRRRALGLSPFRGGFFEVPLDLGEERTSLVATGDIATLTTSQRILIFRSATGSWEERRLGIGY